MHTNERINKLIEETMHSIDNAERAAVKPFLLTRIHARMSKGTESAWEKAGWFISRPAVAFTGLCLVLLFNTMVIISKKTTHSETTADQTVQNSTDEFSYTVATIYDIENTQP